MLQATTTSQHPAADGPVSDEQPRGAGAYLRTRRLRLPLPLSAPEGGCDTALVTTAWHLVFALSVSVLAARLCL